MMLLDTFLSVLSEKIFIFSPEAIAVVEIVLELPYVVSYVEKCHRSMKLTLKYNNL